MKEIQNGNILHKTPNTRTKSQLAKISKDQQISQHPQKCGYFVLSKLATSNSSSFHFFKSSLKALIFGTWHCSNIEAINIFNYSKLILILKPTLRRFKSQRTLHPNFFVPLRPISPAKIRDKKGHPQRLISTPIVMSKLYPTIIANIKVNVQ